MRVFVVGASKGIGLQTTRQALEHGYNVRALARPAAATSISNPNLEEKTGDALNYRDVEAAPAGVEAVVAALDVGPGDLFRPANLFSDATGALITAMKAKAVKRLICGSGTGDGCASISCFQRVPFQIVFGHAYEDKGRQDRPIMDSLPDWTIARPEVLTKRPRTLRYQDLRESSKRRNEIISRSNHETPVLVD